MIFRKFDNLEKLKFEKSFQNSVLTSGAIFDQKQMFVKRRNLLIDLDEEIKSKF